MKQTPLALTMGDPAGIGGEIAVKAWRYLRGGPVSFVLLDDPDRIAALGANVVTVSDPREAPAAFASAVPVLPIRLSTPAESGQPDTRHAVSILASIETAVRLTTAGQTSAVVTNPIAKSSLYGAGFAYPGHTEFLGALTGTPHPVMMLACPQLRVVPVTVHVSLRHALDMLTTERIITAARMTDAALRRDFAIAAPRLAIAGLNPHAGEGGALGREEIDIVAPAIALLRQEGIDARGPFAPDSMFSEDARAGYDAAICLYHDQALIPLKALDMHHGVNITLGLPLIRTSPDHGTAFDIAGKGIADPRSLIAALTMAHDLAARRQST